MMTISGSSLYSSVTASSQQLTLTIGVRYAVVSTTACWIKLGTNPTAVASQAESIYLPADTLMSVIGRDETSKLAVIRASADGGLCAAVIW